MGWKHGSTVADAQNFARELMETPCNHLTPAKFVEIVSDKLSSVADKMEYIGRWILLAIHSAKYTENNSQNSASV